MTNFFFNLKKKILQVSLKLVQSAEMMVMSLSLSQSHPQQSLGLMSSCLSLISTLPSPHPLIKQLFPAGAASPPDVGLAVLGRDLDWQCNWIQVSETRLLTRTCMGWVQNSESLPSSKFLNKNFLFLWCQDAEGISILSFEKSKFIQLKINPNI